MVKLKTGGTNQEQIIKHALFGRSVKIRMQALLLIAQEEVNNGGWLLETILKFENLSTKN